MVPIKNKITPATGPLKANPSNPRYFTDGTGRAIYLTGSHTWSNFKDMGKTDPPPPFDFEAYLDFLQQYNHNFIRMWTWEPAKGRLERIQPVAAVASLLLPSTGMRFSTSIVVAGEPPV